MNRSISHLAWIGFVLLGTAFGAVPASAVPASPDVLIGSSNIAQSIGPELDIHIDASGQLTLADMQAKPDRFHPAGPATYSGLHGDGRLWIRLKVLNTTAKATSRWLVVGKCLQEHVDLYQARSDGSIGISRNGTRVPVEARDIPARDVLFPLVVQSGETQTLYLAISGAAMTAFRLSLWDSGKFLYQSQNEAALKYLATGTNMLLIAACILAATARRRGTLALGGVGYLLLCVYSMVRDGYGVGLLPADGPLWQQQVMQGLLAAAWFCQILFAREFLNLPDKSPAISRVLLAAAGCMAVLTLLAAVVFLPWASLVSTAIVCVMLTALTWRYAENAATWSYLAWWGLVWVGLLVTFSKGIGWLPMDTVQGLLPTVLGLVLATLTLSYGLYRSVTDIQHAAESARDQLISQQRSESVRLRLAVRSKTREQRAALLEARRSAAEKSDFLSMMAHELRTPLHIILGHGQLLRRDLRHKPYLRLDAIERNAKKLQQLVEHAFSYSRGRSDAVELDPVPVDLQVFLDHLLDEAPFGAGSDEHRFSLSVQGQLPDRIIVDAQRLQQVLLNLIANAFKYASEGSVKLIVEVVSQNPCFHLRFSVTDMGEAIPEQDRQRIFEPFTRRATNRHQPGQGLGLTIVRQLLRAMGSDIHLRSEFGKGNCFTFELHLEGGEAIPVVGTPEVQAAMAVPSAELLGPLGKMVVLGEVVELQRWVEEFRPLHPEWAEYFDAIDKCCASVDLAGLSRLLALARVRRTTDAGMA